MKHYLQLHLLVLLLATTAILGELISLPAATLVIWRTLFAAVGAAAWVGLVRRRPLWPGRRAALAFLGIGFIVGLHWICFFGAIKLSNISVCLAGMATISLFTAFTEPFLEKRRVRPFEVLLGLLVVAGIGLVAGFVGREHLLGLGVALISAFLASVFPVLNRRFVTGGSDPTTMVAWEMVGAFTAGLVLFPFTSGGVSLFAWQGYDWLWLLLLAWVCTIFAHGFHITLLRHLSAYTMNLAFNFEPLYGIIAAALFFGEHKGLHPLFYAGMATILLANLLHPLIVHRLRKRLPPEEPAHAGPPHV
ncbi:DMT family transporter [Luteolibacter flavescens]|uniref:DMT family transporter n=1 Tax=Luteolibacter flavescens TaxID=1859460 RepID=A0ABT3FQ10_9BACT|nr:DMT family transporter [Luteolibacter flavescens]MCW1885660.1 DMT family transporter [Luteolibacter flavescens]